MSREQVTAALGRAKEPGRAGRPVSAEKEPLHVFALRVPMSVWPKWLMHCDRKRVKSLGRRLVKLMEMDRKGLIKWPDKMGGVGE